MIYHLFILTTHTTLIISAKKIKKFTTKRKKLTIFYNFGLAFIIVYSISCQFVFLTSLLSLFSQASFISFSISRQLLKRLLLFSSAQMISPCHVSFWLLSIFTINVLFPMMPYPHTTTSTASIYSP